MSTVFPLPRPSSGPDRGHAGHGHQSARPERRVLVGALAITLVFFAVELVGGWLAGSLALLSDAGHMLSDVAAMLLSLFALHFAALKAPPEKSYGWYRLEILSALANGVLLSVVAIFILREAWTRFQSPAPVAAPLLMLVAVVGLVANLAAAALLHRDATNLNVRGAYLHVLGDTLSSGAVLLGGAAIWWTDEPRVDPVVGAIIAVIILWTAQRLVREAVDVLLEAIPKGIQPLEVDREIAAVPGVIAVHDLHIWSLTTGLEALSAHVQVAPGDLPHTDHIRDQINQVLLARFRISHTTIQIESDPGPHPCAAQHETTAARSTVL